ncbi:MAG: copper chaperone PCu(A)C [Candidatus Latescibacteria bacterium]|jgi:hypothetical protein|nr:copper chaperone PCu(A)C [Candidatus Latescibacterota bacterium]
MKISAASPIILSLFPLFLLTCSESTPSHITIKNVTVRQNIPPQTITAAYMAIHNTGPLTALTSVSTPAADITELHAMTHDGNIMRMKKINRLPIPANGSATLQPRGNHLMLIGLKHNLIPGDSLALTLTFTNGQQQTVQASITPINHLNP